MYKDENERMHDEDVDLTKMIHAYRQDDELHRKIEEMKKQKEQEKTKKRKGKCKSFNWRKLSFFNFYTKERRNKTGRKATIF